jgi:hypothetical protein
VNAAFAVETFLDGIRTDRERMTTMMQRGQFLVAEEEPGQLVAAVYVERRNDGRGHFGMLTVGRVMIEAAEDRCRKLECKFMDNHSSSFAPGAACLLPKIRVHRNRHGGVQVVAFTKRRSEMSLHGHVRNVCEKIPF